MATDSIERLHYYERQYLGATDFAEQQAYHRDMRRRHNLAHHAWGIVTGLQLEERRPANDPTGPLDVYVRPGFAVDGFGREIVMLEPTPLDRVDFRSFEDVADHEVWIRYAEEPLRDAQQLCDGDDGYTRLRETFRIVVDPRAPKHGPIIVGGATVTVPPDLSVPHQELPDADQRWLVRLGTVRWDAPNAAFLPAGTATLTAGRTYAGAVAATILAPAGRLRLRDRPAGPPTGADTDDLAAVEGSLRVDGVLTARVESHLMGPVGAGTNAPGSALDVRGQARVRSLAVIDAAGAPYPNNLLSVRALPEGATSRPWLELAGAGQQGEQRIALTAARTHVSGDLGIGTTTPSAHVHLRRDGNAPAQVLVENADGGALAGTRVIARQDQSRGIEAGHIGTGAQPFRDRGANTAFVSALGASAALAINHDGLAPITFHTDGWRERLRISPGGDVGIGTPSPAQALHIRRDQYATTQVLVENIVQGPQAGTRLVARESPGRAAEVGHISSGAAPFRDMRANIAYVAALAGAGELALNTQGLGPITFHTDDWRERMRISSAGDVGIGTNNPLARLDVQGTLRVSGAATFGGTLAASSAVTLGSAVTAAGPMLLAGRIGVAGWPSTPHRPNWGGGIRTWDLEAEGTIWSRSGYLSGPADLAELFETEGDLEPGDVVAVAADGELAAVTEERDPRTVGIVSTSPGMVLNSDPERDGPELPIALAGRVPCKVTAANGSIRPGDLLTASARRGHAMKATPVEIGGEELFRPGTIVARALEAHARGTGVIQVMVMSA